MDEAIHDIRECLLDVDGSCRDMNFKRPTWSGILALMRQLQTEFSQMRFGASTCGELDNAEVVISRVKRDGGYVQLLFSDGTDFLRELQLYISTEKDGSPFIELTFFPQDVVPSPSLAEQFTDWLSNVRVTLRASEGFARYENASWTFGDRGKHSGVFFVSVDKHACSL